MTALASNINNNKHEYEYERERDDMCEERAEYCFVSKSLIDDDGRRSRFVPVRVCDETYS